MARVRAAALVLTMLVLLWLPDAVDAVRLKEAKREVRRSTHERNQQRKSSDANESRDGIVEASPPAQAGGAGKEMVTAESSAASIRQILDTINEVVAMGVPLDDITANLILLLQSSTRGRDGGAGSTEAQPDVVVPPSVLPSESRGLLTRLQGMRHTQGGEMVFFMARVLVDLFNSGVDVPLILGAIRDVANVMELGADPTASSSNQPYRGPRYQPVPDDAPEEFWNWLGERYPGVLDLPNRNNNREAARMWILWRDAMSRLQALQAEAGRYLTFLALNFHRG